MKHKQIDQNLYNEIWDFYFYQTSDNVCDFLDTQFFETHFKSIFVKIINKIQNEIKK